MAPAPRRKTQHPSKLASRSEHRPSKIGARRKKTVRGRREKVSSRVRDIFRIKRENLFDLLSEILVLEKSNIQLFTLTRDRAESPEIRARVEKLLTEAEMHANALQKIIRTLGGNPVYVSYGAQVQEQRAKALLELDLGTHDQTLVDVENILINESREQVYWAFLKTIAPQLEDPQARDMILKIIGEMEKREFAHLVWAQDTMTRLLLERALRPAESEDEQAA